MTQVRNLFFYLMALAFGASASGEIRTFTDVDGGQVTGRLISVDRSGMINLQSVPDGKSVTIHGSQLTSEDQIYVRRWMDGGPESSEAWQWLRVHTDLPIDEVRSVGINNAFRRIGPSTWEGFVPEGSWIEVPMRRGIENTGFTYRRPVFQYRGAAEWHLSWENGRIYRQRDHQERELVYFSLGYGRGFVDTEVAEAVLADIVAPDVCVDVTWRALPTLKGMELPLGAVLLSSRREENSLDDLRGIDAAAAVLPFQKQTLEVVANFPRLQCLKFSVVSGVLKEVLQPESDLTALGDIPHLTTLDLNLEREPLNSLQFLANCSQLKFFYLRAWGESSQILKIPPLTQLEALAIDSKLPIDPGSFSPLSNLHSLHVSEHIVARGLPFRDLPRLCSINLEGLEDAKRKIDILPAAVLPNLRQVITEIPIDLPNFKHLRHAELDGRDASEAALRQVPMIADQEFYNGEEKGKDPKGPELTWLRLSWIKLTDEAVVEEFTQAPGLADLETLVLLCCRIENLEPLSQLPALVGLELNTCNNVSSSRETIDLSDLPRLHYAKVDNMSAPVVKGIVEHQSLEYLYLRNLDNLESLEEVGENQRMVSFYLSNCDRLADITVLQRFQKLRSLQVRYVDSMTKTAARAVANAVAPLDYRHLAYHLDERTLESLRD